MSALITRGEASIRRRVRAAVATYTVEGAGSIAWRKLVDAVYTLEDKAREAGEVYDGAALRAEIRTVADIEAPAARKVYLDRELAAAQEAARVARIERDRLYGWLS